MPIIGFVATRVNAKQPVVSRRYHVAVVSCRNDVITWYMNNIFDRRVESWTKKEVTGIKHW